MAGTGGMRFAIRLQEYGEEKVARQVARLDRKLDLLRNIKGTKVTPGRHKSAKGFYNAGIYGQKIYEKLYGKGSRSFRKQLQKLMLDIAVTVTLEIISMSKGTTGNAASAWYISINKNEHDYGGFQNDPAGYVRENRAASKDESIFHAAKNAAIARESGKRDKNAYLPEFKNKYTIYITNYAYVASGEQIGRFVFDGYYAAKFYDTPELGKYESPHVLSNIDAYVQGRYTELFRTGIKRILRNLKG